MVVIAVCIKQADKTCVARRVSSSSQFSSERMEPKEFALSFVYLNTTFMLGTAITCCI